MMEKMFDMENKEELLKYFNSLDCDKEFEELMKNNIQEQDTEWFDQIKNQLIQFRKIELYKWLFISSIHPSNIKYIHRYELLLYILINIPDEKFINKELDRNKFQHFIQWFEKKFSSYFSTIEDWIPFNQLKLIPIFFKSKKFYFFYGSLERPYEFYKQLQEILFMQNIEELKKYENAYINSLTLQTEILKKLNFDNEAKKEYENMYIPSIKFLKKYSIFIEIKNINTSLLHSSMNNFEFGRNNFNGIFCEINKKYFYIFPHNHIEIFYDKIEKYLYDKNNLNCLNKVNINSKIKKKKTILQFFGIKNILKQLYDPILENDCANYFDITVRVDANKIILCKFVKHSKDMLDTLDDIADESFKELQKIKENKYIGLNYINESPLNCNIVPTKVLNFKVLVLFEKISFDYMLAFSRDWKQKNIFIYNTIDIEPIFELLEEKDSDSILSFIQYLEAEKKLSAQNKHPMIQADVLDSFAYYYQNNESFYVMGNQPDMMFFDTHQWSDFYNEYLYGKYQDNIYELIEAKFPNQFNLINHAMGETYNFMDSSTISGGRCVKFQNKLIWIMYPIALNCIDIEVKTFEFVGQFISFYLDKYKRQLFKLISKYGFDFTKQDFTVGIYPSSLILRINELSHLIPYIENIQSKKIVFLTKKTIHNDKLHTFIIYHADMDSLNDLFRLALNFNPEKKIFKDFLESILNYYKIVNIHEISDNFINENWNIKERAFTFNSKYVDNPRLESYKNPKKIQLSFLQGVNQEIVTYLKNLNIESKEYWDIDAKNLNNLIFEFLQIKLENEISKFNNSIIYYCYEQIEYIEGKREKDSFSAGVHSSHYIEFDIEKQFNEDRMEISQLTTCAKHILHTILKVNPKGYKALVDSDWYYLMALSSVINETIQRSDHLHHKLVKAGIKITTNYEMIDIDEISSINFHAYHQQITNSKIHESKKLIQKEKIPIKNENPKKIPIMDEKLNLAWFKEYDFYLDDMLVVLSNLGRFDFKKDNYFPLNFISFEEINNFIQTYIIEPPSSITLQKILNFLSLSYETFNNFKYIDYSIDRLMQKKERINLSPFIKINDKYLFGNQLTILSTKAWFYPLKEGDIPFSIEDNSLVKEELKIIHRKLDLELENDSYNVAKELLGENYSIKTLKNFKRIHKSFERLPPCGEIDLLLVNPKTHTIFVLDAKNINKKLFTSAIKRELRDFFHGRDKKKSYLEKLNMKVDFINNNLEKVLGYFKLNNDEKWNIKKGFVVNTLYFSAFYEEKVDFILLDDLHEYLKQ